MVLFKLKIEKTMRTTPTYNLNVVVRETGIKPDTLRAWERRYGLPEPSRTEGGHRLYSERDIATVQWLVDRQEEGLRISHAVDLWNQMTENGQDPLLVKPIDRPSDTREVHRIEDTTEISELRKRWVNACLRFDEAAAENIANYAFALYPVETVCFEVLLAGLAEIGDSWYLGEVSVQQEHFSSSLVIRRLNTLISATPSPTRSRKILVACPPGEQHTVSPLMITFLLRQRGWEVVYLGANVPISRFKETLESVTPRIVILTAQLLTSAATLMELGNYLSQNQYTLAYGGLIFSRNPEIQKMIPGHFLGDNLKTVTNKVEDLIVSPPSIPDIVRKNEEYLIELEDYIKTRPAIELEISEVFASTDQDFGYIEIANHFLAQNIEAIIILGTPELLESEVEWIDELITINEVTPKMLERYLAEYYQSAKRIIGNKNKIVTTALERFRYSNGEGP
jgi:methanogenic corrinoid protein MtbC1